ncbi:uncharacterized protein LOC128221481 [Mya arenaria]|uniref:uncharacterized protein LOC128221481 n=1 Tax=Mya arenaria TaxID=6604 RepID=UPI0022E0BEB3|nr:uncharacterized protein LOC128221481 [Mya arenaria]
MHKDIIVRVLALSCISQVLALGPICYQCDDVPTTKDCDQVVICGEHEKCATRLLFDSNYREYYKLGCIDANVCLGTQGSMLELTSSPGVIGKRSLPLTSGRDFRNRKSRATAEDTVLCLECAATNIRVQLNQCIPRELNIFGYDVILFNSFTGKTF